MAEVRARLIVGIDYGTTYSGLSFATSNASDFKDIHPWTAFPGSSSNTEHCQKAPSWLALASENKELDQNAWGYQVEPGMRTYAWTKLLLDENALESEYDDPGLRRATGKGILKLPKGMTAKDIAAEYLHGMYSMLEKALVEKMGQDGLAHLPMDIWMTVPATWTEKAKLLTKSAARAAGFASRPFDKLMLIPEPEAAAHMALKSSLHHVHNFVQVTDGIMICDLGGGTVDITTYKVKQTTPTLQLTELCVGAGGKCGGTFVDRNLYKLMEERFGESFSSLGQHIVGPGSIFMNQFEDIKRAFSNQNPSRRPKRLNLIMKGLKISAELERFYDEEFGLVTLTQADIKSLFDPVIKKIEDLIEGQGRLTLIDAAQQLHTVVLVGGFGSSPYVKERLQEWCDNRKLRLVTPWNGGWSAIVCGAVLRGLEGSITTEKRCRKHYGYDLGYLYKPLIHDPFDKEIRYIWKDPFNGLPYLSGFLSWQLGKNTILTQDTEIISTFWITCTLLEKKYTKKLYACSLDKPALSIESNRIEVVGEIEYTLDNIDMSTLESKTQFNNVSSEFEIVYKIHLTVHILLADESGVLVFKISHNGMEVGRARLVIEDN